MQTKEAKKLTETLDELRVEYCVQYSQRCATCKIEKLCQCIDELEQWGKQ